MNQNPSGVENPSGVDIEKKMAPEAPAVASIPVEAGESASENPQKDEVTVDSIPETTSQPGKVVPAETPIFAKSEPSEAEVAHAIKDEIGDGDLKAASQMVEATSFSD